MPLIFSWLEVFKGLFAITTQIYNCARGESKDKNQPFPESFSGYQTSFHVLKAKILN